MKLAWRALAVLVVVVAMVVLSLPATVIPASDLSEIDAEKLQLIACTFCELWLELELRPLEHSRVL